MKKILWLSNLSLANTGFGKATKEILIRLYKTGKYEICELAAGVSDLDPNVNRVPWRVIGVLPRNEAEVHRFNSADEALKRAFQYGLFRFDEAIFDFKPDIVVCLEDIWAWSGWLTQTKAWNKIKDRCIAAHPFDAEPLSEVFAVFLKDFKNIVTYTEWSKGIGIKAGLPQTQVIPLGVNTDIFKPLDNRKLLRFQHGIKEEDYLVLMVARNQIRKKFDALFESLLYIQKSDPKLYDCIRILPFTHWADQAGFSFPQFFKSRNIPTDKILVPYFCDICKKYHISVEYTGEKRNCPFCQSKECCHTPSVINGLTDIQLNEIYNIADLFVLPTSNEGFGCPICALPNTLVTNCLGHGIPIQNVSKGDYLLDSTGNKNLVLQTMRRKVNEKIVVLKLNGMPTIRCTQNHPFLVIRDGIKCTLRAINLTNRDSLIVPTDMTEIPLTKIQLKDFGLQNSHLFQHLIPKIGNVYGFAKKVGVSYSSIWRALYHPNHRHKNGKRWISRDLSKKIRTLIQQYKYLLKRGENKIPDTLPLTPRNLFAMGLYVAEGNCREEEVMGTFHYKERDIANIFHNFLKSLGASTYIKRINNTMRVYGYLKNGHLFFTQFGISSHTKKIPDFIYRLPPHQIVHFLRGYFAGDGCRSGQCWTTTSNLLAFQVNNLIARCGFRGTICTIKSRKRIIKGKKYHCKKQYCINLNNKADFRLFLSGKTKPPLKERLIRIRKILTSQYNGFVYNIDTDGNSTYLMNGVAVHNCEAKSVKRITISTEYSSSGELSAGYASGLTFDYSLGVEAGTLFYKANIIPSEIAKKIEKAYRLKPERIKEMEEKARQLVLDKYSWDIIGRQWDELLDKIDTPEINWTITEKTKNPNPQAEIQKIQDDIKWICGLYKDILDADIMEETGGKPLENQGVKYWLWELSEKRRSREDIVAFFRKTAQDDLDKRPIELASLLDPGDIKRMLFCIPQSAGDNFLCTSVVAGLHEKYPNYAIYVACKQEFNDIWKNNPNIKRVLPWMDDFMRYGAFQDRFERGIFDFILTPTMMTQLALPNWGHNSKTKSFLIK